MSENSNIPSILEKFKGKKILIIGDVMVDEYLWGSVTRISPEAPVPVVSCEKREHRMGGAANVAINIKSMGAEPIMCSVIGKDEIGEKYKALLEKREMTHKGIIESSERVTTVKTRVIGNHQQLLRVDQEITHFLSPKLELELLNRIKSILHSSAIDGIIFQDYDKGVLTPLIIKQISVLAKELEIPSLVDPKKRSFNEYSHVSLFKPNFKELVEGLNIDLAKSDGQAIFKAVQILHNERQIQNVMVTLSELGVFISNGESFTVFPAEIRDIADVSGAGDTVVSIAALGMASGLTPNQCALLSNIAGGLVCEKIGVVPIEPGLLLNENITLPAY